MGEEAAEAGRPVVERLAVDASIHSFNEAEDSPMPFTDMIWSPPNTSVTSFGYKTHEPNNNTASLAACKKYYFLVFAHTSIKFCV